MSARTSKRNNVMAGMFLILSLVLAVVLSFWVSNIQERWGSFTGYVVSFSLRDGSSGLKKGSPVLLGGKTVGRVEGVDWARPEKVEDGRGVPATLDVYVKVNSDVPLYSNAVVNIEMPILGGLASINIIDLGGPNAKPRSSVVPAGNGVDAEPPTLLAEGGRMHGGLAPGLLAQAGMGPEQVEEIKSTVRSVKQAMSDIAVITGALAINAEGSVDDVVALIKQARGTVDDARTVFNESWSPKVTGILDTGQRVMDDVQTISGEGVEIAGKVNDGIDDVLGVVDSVQLAIDENRESVDQIIANVEATTRHFNEQTTQDIDKLMVRGQSAVEEFGRVGSRAGELIDEQGPQINDILGNVRLAAMDARLFVDELKAQPWRLLRGPNTKESERQLLYASARTYAHAVSDLKAASESLEGVLRRVEAGGAPSLTPEDIAALQRRLREAFLTYQHAEKGLLDAIIEHAPPTD